MERILGTPCQALLIFDADFADDLFGLAQTALAISPTAHDVPFHAPTQRLDHITDLMSFGRGT
jgi:type III restriction enzyme